MMKELCFERDGKKIYGHLHLPKGKGPFPMVIICHGFGADLNDHEYYALMFARNGIAAYCFDFIGGGPKVKSDGKMTEMSVLSEVDDLNTVIDGIQKLPETDKENLFLMGGSQGGYVITYVADQRSDEIRGMIPLYPAYVIRDFVRNLLKNKDEIPDTFRCLGCTVSSLYAIDALSVDIYEHMRYPGKVRIIHGTADSLVPIEYSERAVKIFKDAQLIRVRGADHGFYEKDEVLVSELAVEFVKDTMRL